MIVSTAGSESPKVEVNLERHAKATTIWRVDDFERSAIDWDQFTCRARPSSASAHR
jgi:hypothetical protein